MKKILVTGANGQLGNELQVQSASFSDWKFIFTDFKELDISNQEAVTALTKKEQFYAIINCAAYTAVDKAESEKEKAYQINEHGAAYLAAAAQATGAKIVHISTDFIFDGQQSFPIAEDVSANPLSVYGASKLAGENAVLNASPNALIFRTAWVYSSFGTNFVKTILRLCRERESLSVIYDQVGTPTYARDLAQMILSTLNKSIEQNICGVFNYTNEGIASWYDFALAVRDFANLTTAIKPIPTKQYPTPAVRPKYSVLDKSKIKTVFGIEIPYWRDSLGTCIKLILDSE